MVRGRMRFAGAVAISVAMLTCARRVGAGTQNSKASNADVVAAGRDDFNANCAHCHGEDAEAEDSFYNLPQLLSDKKDDFFYTTVRNGIKKVGMPSFRNVLKPEQMSNILAYLRSVEADEGVTDESDPNK